MENALNLDTVKLAENKKEIVILDQTLLPNQCKYLNISTAGDIWEAIYSLRVRGAPAIGVTGAYAYYVLADQIETDDKEEFVKECTKMMEYINSSRPTAVNLSWALNRMHNVMLTEKNHMNIPELKARLMKEADDIRAKASADAAKTREGAEIYAEQVLTNLERDLTQLQQVVKNGQVYMEKLRTESYSNYDIPSSYEMRNSSSDYIVK